MNLTAAAKKLTVVFFLSLAVSLFPVAAQAQITTQPSALRSFADLFPGISAERKMQAFSSEGIIRALEVGESLEFIPASGSGVNLHSELTRREHNFLAEILTVIPHPPTPFTRLDAYNALGRIANLPEHLFFSHARQRYVPLFEEASRLESDSRTSPIPDPPPATTLPYSSTIFVRLRDMNFGNTFYRGEFSSSHYGIIYRLTNFRAIRFLVFPVLREENLSATLYMEPLTEGMLIYVVAGADVSNFVANRIDMPSAIARRGALFLEWVSAGLKALSLTNLNSHN